MMTFKRWPYWIRGAVLFAVIFIPLFFGEAVGWLFPPLAVLWYALGFPFVITFTSFILGGADKVASSPSLLRMDIFLVICTYALIGALLGWVYGKIKSRKTSNQPSRR